MCSGRAAPGTLARPPPMCIRHDASTAVHTSAPLSRTERTLSARIAPETSGFFSENDRSNPQQDSAFGRSTSVSPSTARTSCTGGRRGAAVAAGTAAGVIRDGVRERCGHVVEAEHVGDVLGQLIGAQQLRWHVLRGRRRRSAPARSACWWRIDAPQEPLGVTIASKPSNVSTWLRTSGRASSGYPVFTCICPQQLCDSGTTTSQPRRRSSFQVAFATGREPVGEARGEHRNPGTRGAHDMLRTDGS